MTAWPLCDAAAAPAAPAPVGPPPQPVRAKQTVKPLAALHAFERVAFPPPLVAHRSAGAPRHRPRISALHPPPLLSSHSRTQLHPDTRRANRPREGWLASLALPDIPVRWNKRLARYLRFYHSNPVGHRIMSVWLRRMGRYRPMLEALVREHDVPRTLMYVAMIESGFDPRRTSHAGATGLWQFMARTARSFGLARDHWIDERRNPRRSTAAALRYLKALRARFGNWPLALAAYNAGTGTVLNAIRKYNTNDYWRLCRFEAGLPWSTTLYVPKVMAAAIVDANRDRLGYADVESAPPLRFDRVAIRRSVSFKRLARLAGVEPEAVALLNPELRRERTPPRRKTWVRVPRGTKAEVYRGLARIGAARYRPYAVRLGDTIESIAERFSLARRTLRRLNGLHSDAQLVAGLTLVIPARAQPHRDSATDGTAVRSARRTADRRDDTDPAAATGQRRLVPLPKGAPDEVPGRKRVFYEVIRGDTLSEIARSLHVSVAELRRYNGLDPSAKLIPRMVLQAFVPRGFDASGVELLDRSRVRPIAAGSAKFLDLHEKTKGRRRVVYRVKPGDTLSRIARRFGLSVGSLMRINRFGRRTTLQIGQRVVVYVPKRGKRAARHRRRSRRSAKRHRRSRRRTGTKRRHR